MGKEPPNCLLLYIFQKYVGSPFNCWNLSYLQLAHSWLTPKIWEAPLTRLFCSDAVKAVSGQWFKQCLFEYFMWTFSIRHMYSEMFPIIAHIEWNFFSRSNSCISYLFFCLLVILIYSLHFCTRLCGVTIIFPCSAAILKSWQLVLRFNHRQKMQLRNVFVTIGIIILILKHFRKLWISNA